jgi:tetratricopeptide (TPR) repeat protein
VGIGLVFSVAILHAAEPKEAALTAEEQQDLEKRIVAAQQAAAEAEAVDELVKARRLRQDVLELCTRRYGSGDWRVTDARRAVEDATLLAQLTADQRGQLRQAWQVEVQGLQLYAKAKYGEALPLLQTASDLRIKVLGDAHVLTAQSWNNLAANLHAQGKYAEAESLYRKVLSVYQKRLGELHPHVGQTCNNLGFCLNARGQYAAADPLFRQALATCQKTLGEEDPETANCYNSVGYNLQSQGKYAAAEPFYLRALQLREKLLGENHPHTISSINNVASNLHDLGRFADAEALYRRALALGRKLLGENNPELAGSYNNLASCHHDQGNYDAADPYYRRALAISQEVLGEEHRQTVWCYNNLATNLSCQGHFAEARRLHQRALEIRRRALGEQHPDTATSYHNLAETLSAQGLYAAAEPLQRRALTIFQQMLGEEHSTTADGCNNLAVTLNRQGKHAEAEQLQRRALAIWKATYGNDHLRTAAGYNNLGMTLASQKQEAAAEAEFQRALAIWQKVVGEDHPWTAQSYLNVAATLTHRHRAREAEPLFRRALEIRQKVLGEDHPETAASWNGLGFNLKAQGNFAEAEPAFRRSLALRQQLLGQAHLDTIISCQNLADDLNRQGKYGDALALAETAARGFIKVRGRVAFSGLERAAFASVSSPLPQLSILLARAGRTADAWHWHEEGLSRGLLDDLTARNGRPLTADERQREDELRGQLDQCEKQLLALAGLKALTAELTQQRADLLRQQNELQGAWSRMQAELEQKYGPAAGAVFDLARIQKQLRPNAALLTWVDLEPRPPGTDRLGDHWACLVRAKGPPVWVQLTGSGDQGSWTEDDSALPDRLRQSLQKGSTDPSTWQSLARRLEEQRVTPLVPHLSGNSDRPAVTHLIILPSPALAGVPIEVFANRRSISYAPSGTLFAYLQEQRRDAGAGDRLLAVGDPAFSAAPAPAPRPTFPTQGLLVASVQPGSSAAEAGIRSGDVLVRCGATQLASINDLKTALTRTSNAGDHVVTVWRDGQTLTVQLLSGSLGLSVGARPLADELKARYDARDAAALRLRGSSFTPLPGTRREVESLAGLFPEKKLLLGPDASERQLDTLARGGDLSQYRFVHVATHGHADADQGMRSFLALASDPVAEPTNLPPLGRKLYDGRLTAADMLAWKLNADLVTLSACETGLGQKEGGEGYVGFAQALFLAGARSLVLSEWKVDDQATALLMQRFYQNLLGKRQNLDRPLGKAAALAEAKRWLRSLSSEEAKQFAAELPARSRGSEVETTGPITGTRPYEHPYFWAGFILIGDPGDVSQAVPVLAAEATGVAVASESAPKGKRWWPWPMGITLLGVSASLFLMWRRWCRSSPSAEKASGGRQPLE